MRPGSPRKLLGICLLEVVFLVDFVRHLFLGDLLLLFSFLSSGCLFCSCIEFCIGSPFPFVVLFVV